MPTHTSVVPLDPAPAERTCHRRLSPGEQGDGLGTGHPGLRFRVSMNVDATRSTYACRWSSQNSRSWVQSP